MSEAGPAQPVAPARSAAAKSLLLPLLVTAVVLWQGLPAVVDALNFPPAGDFGYMRNAGRVLETPYRSLLYRGPVDLHAWETIYRYPFPLKYGYAPAVAVATSALPLADLNRTSDYWDAMILASMLALGVLVAFSFQGWAWRAAAFSCVLCSEVLLLNLKIGQTGATAAALTALGLAAYAANEARGGALLGLLVLKPTALPVAVLALGSGGLKLKPWRNFALVAGVAGLLPFVWLGGYAMFDWFELLWDRAREEVADTTKYDQGVLAPLGSHGLLPIAGLAMAMIVALALTAYTRRRLGIHHALALAAVAQLLTNPHSVLYEWGVGFAVVMMLRRSGHGPFGSDLGGGLMLLLFFLVGQFAWQHRDGAYPIEPLTLWALLTGAVIVALAFSAGRRVVVQAEPPVLEGAIEPLPSAGS